MFLPPTPTDSFSYDADGNLTRDGKANATCPGTDGKYAYAWDAENRLICVAPVSPVQGDGMLEFRYDYMGRRVRKVYSIYNGWVWNAERTEQYVYDGWNVVLVLDDANVTQRKYTWGLDLSGTLHGAGGIGGLLAAVETQGTPTTADDDAYWFLYDANGNVWQVLNGTPAYPTIAARYEYDPYGNVIASSSGDYADDNPIRFSTKWFDTELAGASVNGAVGTSGLGYWGYRYYSPRLGRWVSLDPIEELGATAARWYGRESLPIRNRYALNLYAALDNSPAVLIDPHGMITSLVWICVPISWGPGGSYTYCDCTGMFRCLFKGWFWDTSCRASYTLKTWGDTPDCAYANGVASTDAGRAFKCTCGACFGACAK